MNTDKKTTIIKMDTPPMKDGKIDLEAILATHGITGVDLSKVQIIKNDAGNS